MAAKVTGGSTPRRASTPRNRPAQNGGAGQLPRPVPPREPVRPGYQLRPPGAGADTDADMVMLPGGFSFEPIRFEDEDAPDEIRVPLFYGPDGTEYTVWANPPPRIGLRYMDEFAQLGGDTGADAVATRRLLIKMLGEDGHAALLRMKGLDTPRYSKIIAIIHRIALGPLEVPKDAESD